MFLLLLAIGMAGGILFGVSVNAIRHGRNVGYALIGVFVGLIVVAAAYFTAMR